MASYQRDTSIIALELDTGEVCIVASLSSRTDTQVITIDPTEGALRFTSRWGIDEFESEAEALRAVKLRSQQSELKTTYAYAILGYAAFGSYGLLLLATKVKATVKSLPGGGKVQTVVESVWIKVPLRGPHMLSQSKAEAENANELAKIENIHLHYYCECRDITRPFPSAAPVDKPESEFVWNDWLSEAFKALNLPFHCVVLLQGFAEERMFEARGKQVRVVLTARRSRLHPGTRYLARGLNAAGSTGNEIECEQLVWSMDRRHQQPDTRIRWSRYLWRRGTVPIWWGAEIKTTFAEAEIYVADDPYAGAGRYYRRLVRRYGTVQDEENWEETADRKGKAKLPIYCVNLLRNGVGKPEQVLSEHFEKSVNYLRGKGEVPAANLKLLNYDWHGLRVMGKEQTVEGLWKLLKSPTEEVGFTVGEFIPERQPFRGVEAEAPVPGRFSEVQKQSGIIRFNCADSLDRTNAASFFGAVQVLVEQCRQLGCSIVASGSGSFLSGESSGRTTPEPPRQNALPPGWEARIDQVTKQTYYVDHNNHTTTWTRPKWDPTRTENGDGEVAWKQFDTTVAGFSRQVSPTALAGMAELFLLAGDIHATLYTGSKAMHSEVIEIFKGGDTEKKKGGSASTVVSVAANLKITLQRRAYNVLFDKDRQKQLEIFLGLHRHRHFPTLGVRPLQVLSRPYAFILKPVPSFFSNLLPPSALISLRHRNAVWVCPAADVVEVFIFLSEPCCASHLLLTVMHGLDDTTAPCSLDVRVGRHLDSLKLVLEQASIPRCAAETQLAYTLRGPVRPEDAAVTRAGVYSSVGAGQGVAPLYEYEEEEGEIDFLTRVVAVTLYPSTAGASITLGQIEVLGTSVVWDSRLAGANALSVVPGEPQLGSTQWYHPSTGDSAPAHLINSPSITNLLHDAPISVPNPAPIMPAASAINAAPVFDLLSDFGSPMPTVSSEAATPFDDPFGDFDPRGLSTSTTPPVPDTAVGGGGVISEEATSPLFSTWDPFGVSAFPSNANDVSSQGQGPSIEAVVAPHVSEHPPAKVAAPAPVVAIGSWKKGKAQDGVSSYTKLAKDLLARKQQPVQFLQAMELEIGRLRLGLSSAQRDRVLVQLGCDPATLDPNLLLSYSDALHLRQKLAQLGALSLVVEEEEETAATGTGSGGLDSNEAQIPSEWTDHVLLGDCTHTRCDIRVARERKGVVLEELEEGDVNKGSKELLLLCKACRRRVCSACLAGKGSSLISRGMREVASAGGGDRARSSRPVDMALCQRCCEPMVRNAVLLDRVRVLAAARRSARVRAAAEAAMRHLSFMPSSMEQYGSRSGSEVSLAELPYAGLLFSVPSAEGSLPADWLLAPPKAGAVDAFWQAPAGVSSVDMAIVLATPSFVSKLVLWLSPQGFTVNDAPTVDIWVGDTITHKTFVGKWDVATSVARSSQMLQPAPPAGHQLVYPFPNSLSCRIVFLKLSLPSPSRGGGGGGTSRGTSSSSSNNPFALGLAGVPGLVDLLGVDSTFPAPPQASLNSAPAVPVVPVLLHLRRLQLLGQRASLEAEDALSAPPQASEKNAYRSFLEQPPRLGRVTVQVEAEYAKASGRISEQVVGAAVPSVAGFRLDSIACITRTSSSSSSPPTATSMAQPLAFIDDCSNTSPSLSIRVLALQERKRSPVPIGEFLLPSAKLGTPLYFDFPSPVAARTIIFELLGAALGAEDAVNSSATNESTDGEGGGPPRDAPTTSPALVLTNKIRMYRYANVAESGKWQGFAAMR